MYYWSNSSNQFLKQCFPASSLEGVFDPNYFQSLVDQMRDFGPQSWSVYMLDESFEMLLVSFDQATLAILLECIWFPECRMLSRSGICWMHAQIIAESSRNPIFCVNWGRICLSILDPIPLSVRWYRLLNKIHVGWVFASIAKCKLNCWLIAVGYLAEMFWVSQSIFEFLWLLFV